MQAEEIDTALDELENRLDRLRSLYEQYFLGIEKIEPGVARKDVDRRFWLLRRTQIRNTARRFRLQTLVQRYNTFQQYWARICREIENGTYSRHLLRAQKKLGEEPKTWAAKRRLGYFRKKNENGSGTEGVDEGEDLGAMLEDRTDLAAEAERAAAEALESADARAKEAAARREAAAPVASPAKAVPAANVSRPGPRRRADLEMLDLDLDDALGASAPLVRPPARPAMPAAGPVPVQPPPNAARPEPVAPAARSAPEKPAPAPARPAPAASPGPEIRKPAAPQAPSPVAASPAPGGRMPLPKPGPPPARPSPVERPASPATAAKGSAGITDDRLKQIHAELSAAKRQMKQADAVSLDALSKSLRESEQKIRAQHPGRTVDFHVVVKDGKPVVKPIVRK